MTIMNITELNSKARIFSGLNANHEAILKSVSSVYVECIPETIGVFYTTLNAIPEVETFFHGRVDHLKQTLQTWLRKLFDANFDDNYVAFLHKTGDVHVDVGLPVEYLVSGIGIIQRQLNEFTLHHYQGDAQKCIDITSAINTGLVYSLFIMQSSYQSSKGKILDQFLTITGMSKPLFEKLAKSFSK